MTVCFNIAEGSNAISGENRVLRNGSNALSYQLYSNAARSQIWGSTTSANLPTPVRLDFYLAKKKTYNQSIPVHARLLGSRTTAATGSHQDSYSSPQVRITGVLMTSSGGCSCDQVGEDAGLFSALNVVAAVASNCLVNATDLNFGSTSLLSQSVASTSLSVQCTKGTAYQAGLSNGLHASGSALHGGEFTSGGVWLIPRYRTRGSMGNTSQTMKSGTGTGTPANQTVYGLVPAQPTAPAGSYADTVQVNVSY